MKQKMKFKATVLFSILFLSHIQAQRYFVENFELGIIPSTWNQEYVIGSPSVPWEIGEGGDEIPQGLGDPIQIPNAAKSGMYNAVFPSTFFTEKKTKLITPFITLGAAVKPELSFWHAQPDQEGPDILRVFFRSAKQTEWMLLKEYLLSVQDWTYQNMFLPDSLLDDSVQIAFEGETKWKMGIVIDSIEIIERGVIPFFIKELKVNQTSIRYLPTQSKTSPVINVLLDAFGNTGKIFLEDIAVKSLLTKLSDIQQNGVSILLYE
ncbi:MAG: hypothetical protein HC896_15005 [Bacteroidales bacterium]|nr:hypothetical protein [Bacteroidales bacterium]